MHSFSSPGVIRLFYQYLYQKTLLLFLPLTLNSLRHQHACSLFTSEDQKKVGLWHILYFCHTFRPCSYDITDTFATHFGLVYMTSLTLLPPCSWRRWHRLLGAKWQHSWSRFCDFQMLVFIKQDEKSSGKLSLCHTSGGVYVPCILLACQVFLIDWWLVIERYSPLSSRLTVLACNFTWVTSFL